MHAFLHIGLAASAQGLIVREQTSDDKIRKWPRRPGLESIQSLILLFLVLVFSLVCSFSRDGSVESYYG